MFTDKKWVDWLIRIVIAILCAVLIGAVVVARTQGVGNEPVEQVEQIEQVEDEQVQTTEDFFILPIEYLQPSNTPVAIEAEAGKEIIATEDEVEVSPEPTRPPRYGFTEEEIILLARLLCGDKDVDGDGEYDFDYGFRHNYDQISLVLCVVMNRVRSDKFPNTVKENLYRQGQFTRVLSWTSEPDVSDVAMHYVRTWCELYDSYNGFAQSIPEDHYYFNGDGKRNYSH